MKVSPGLTLALLAQVAAAAPGPAQNSTYYNPVLPGWHSDPSCVHVDGIFYCVTSTFISFPGLPIYASRDLINWKHVSHVWNRESQLPGYSWATVAQQHGMYAATIRYRAGTFYVICEYLGVAGKDAGVLFRTTNPFDDAAWSDALTFPVDKIDPDLFWDDEEDNNNNINNSTRNTNTTDENKAYVATQGIQLQELDLTTGAITRPTSLWNGTGGVWPEGPHLYKKDGYYYLLIAEGGTALDHSITMARLHRLTQRSAPEPAPANPVLTNRGTDSYFQTVGHGDLFQDGAGNWWGMALATRSGPAYKSYPMGREAVLFPVTWRTGEWPVMQPVRGRMSGWPLPPRSRDVPGSGPFNGDPDVYDFPVGEPLPRNLVHWRVPRPGTFTVTEKGLAVVLGRNDLTGWPNDGDPEEGGRAVSFVGRRQTHSLFRFGVDLDFAPREAGQEAGVVAFLTQAAHVQLGVVMGEEGKLSFRFNGTSPDGEATLSEVPAAWAGKPVRLEIEMAEEPTEYTFSAMLAADEGSRVVVGKASAELLSGGSGSFVGTLLGIYATCNGAGSGVDCPSGTPKAYFRRWRYTGIAQYISADEKIPSIVDSLGQEET
ncbi:glycoside hydrolase family 43 protein [Thermothielavioides terrestris NRRL 8126]|uniref:Glycoside hydrolase family 43 protein n=1 Tax=Thermothielavioides terrestris (strain ATCC 38088 / NRRL 8126) TaxID=578455 RepID=G2RDN5_THETT|nr:glycoside hydrolase family 43 protein [Thermothielavioides terrestris NRRL 8126]AEO70820.1 glycoside hydrolase family 43 protein [Thermothielavioides terrestris NRRL 8126]